MICGTGLRSRRWHNIGSLNTDQRSSRPCSSDILKCVTRMASHWRKWKTREYNKSLKLVNSILLNLNSAVIKGYWAFQIFSIICGIPDVSFFNRERNTVFVPLPFVMIKVCLWLSLHEGIIIIWYLRRVSPEHVTHSQWVLFWEMVVAKFRIRGKGCDCEICIIASKRKMHKLNIRMYFWDLLSVLSLQHSTCNALLAYCLFF